MISQKKTNALDGRDCSHIADTLAEGQTSVSFSLVGDGEITADLAGSISASYAGTDPNNSQTAESNTWALSLQDTGEITRTYLGDERG